MKQNETQMTFFLCEMSHVRSKLRSSFYNMKDMNLFIKSFDIRARHVLLHVELLLYIQVNTYLVQVNATLSLTADMSNTMNDMSKKNGYV